MGLGLFVEEDIETCQWRVSHGCRSESCPQTYKWQWKNDTSNVSSQVSHGQLAQLFAKSNRGYYAYLGCLRFWISMWMLLTCSDSCKGYSIIIENKYPISFSRKCRMRRSCAAKTRKHSFRLPPRFSTSIPRIALWWRWQASWQIRWQLGMHLRQSSSRCCWV